MSNKKQKERMISLDFARFICALIVVCFHFYCHSLSDFKLFQLNANGSWGDIVNTLFFCLSGAVLYLNYSNISSVKKFYINRWKTIYPTFYFCYIPLFILNLIKNSNAYAGIKHWTIILSILGLDGYFLYRISDYYLIGEWFLGAIIILYLIYPIILWLMKKSKYIIPVLLIIGYIIMLYTNIFFIYPIKNLIACLASFYIGMLLMKYRLFFKKNIWIFISSLTLFSLLYFVKIIINNPNIIIQQIQGILFFVLIVQVYELIKNPIIDKVSLYLSRLSYPAFLIQHIVILAVLNNYNPSNPYISMGLLLLCIAIIIISSIIISKIMDMILKIGKHA